MKTDITLTDILLIVVLLISLLTAVLHPAIPAIICATVHVIVTGFVAVVHINSSRQRSKAVHIPEKSH